jgi:hypothetical protein
VITSVRAGSDFASKSRGEGSRPPDGGLATSRRAALQHADPLFFRHPGHLHVAAEREPGDHVLRLSPPETGHLRPESERKALHFDVDGLGREEVAELVHEDQHTKHDHGGQNSHHCIHELLSPQLAVCGSGTGSTRSRAAAEARARAGETDCRIGARGTHAPRRPVALFKDPPR